MSNDYSLRFVAPQADEQFVTVNGHRLAGVRELKEIKKQEIFAVHSIGQKEISATVSGELGYELILTRKLPDNDGIDFAELGVFRLKTADAVYSGCKCSRVERITKPDAETVERVCIMAPNREEKSDE